MTAPKKGDRVKVEYEGTYGGAGTWIHVGVGPFPPHLIEFDIDGESETYCAGVPADAKLTVIVPPVKVGDVATREVLDALPLGSAIVTGSGLIASLYLNTGRAWFFSGDPGSYTSKRVAEWNPTVIYIPPDET